MLLSLVPFMAPPLVAPGMAQIAGAVVMIRDAETESFLPGIAHRLLRAAGVNAGLVRITLPQPRPIDAFDTSGNRMFIHTGLIQRVAWFGELVQATASVTGGPICHGPATLPLADVDLAEGALAEKAVLEDDDPRVRMLAQHAEEMMPPGPQKLRAQHLRNAAQRDNLPKEQREQDDAMRRRYPR